MITIYKILNKVTNKIYIGKTSKSLNFRFNKHKKCASKKINRYLYDSMNYYGFDNFEISELEVVNESNGNEREMYWIHQLDSKYPNGYNMTIGGDGGYTLKYWSDLDRNVLYKKQGDKRRGKRSDAWKLALSKAAKIRESNKSPEMLSQIRKKCSDTLKRKYLSGEIKPTTPKMFGKENPNYICVDIEYICNLIKLQWKLIDIAKEYNTTTVTIGSKLKKTTGKTFTELRNEYGICGPFGKIKRIDIT